jgi:hypothetical protein
VKVLGIRRLAVPMSLASLGAPGCSVLIGLDFGLVPTVAPAPGSRVFSLPVPQDPAFDGAELFGQGVVVDLSTNALGLVLSNGVAVVIGTF